MIRKRASAKTDPRKEELPGRVLTADDVAWLEEYRAAVVKTFGAVFDDAADNCRKRRLDLAMKGSPPAPASKHC